MHVKLSSTHIHTSIYACTHMWELAKQLFSMRGRLGQAQKQAASTLIKGVKQKNKSSLFTAAALQCCLVQLLSIVATMQQHLVGFNCSFSRGDLCKLDITFPPELQWTGQQKTIVCWYI